MSGIKDRESRGWNIYRRADGQFVLQYRRRPGDWREHRISREYTTERQAGRYATAWIGEYHARLREPLAVADDSSSTEERPPTIRELAPKFERLCAANPKLSRAMRVQYRSNVNRHVLSYPEIADVPVTELGSGVLRRWLRKVRDEGRLRKVKSKDEKHGKGGKWVRTGESLAPFTCRNVVNTLTAFFDECMAEEWIDLPANPMRHPGVRKEIPDAVTRAGRRTIIHFNKAAVEALVTSEAVPLCRRMRYLFAVTSGMRDGEIAALRWEDVDLQTAVVSVTKGTTCKGGGVKLTETKTEASARNVPLHAAAARALKSWKAQGWSTWTGRHPKPTDHVFPNTAAALWRPPSAKLLKDDLAALELPILYEEKHPFDFHAFRRTFYTWLRNAAVDRSTIEMIMGHAGSSVGDRHYDARDMERMREAVAKITLDLSRASVIELPLRKAVSDDTRSSDTADLTAARGKGAVKRAPNRQDSRYARCDSNTRHSASKADALSS